MFEMQSPELVPMLLSSVVISGITMVVIVRAWWKTRLFPTALYSLAIACFSGMALDLLLDQTYMPFRDWELVVNGHILWMSNVLLTVFVIGGFLFWYFAIMYSQFEAPPRSALIITFAAGAALLGEIEKSAWSEMIPLTFEIVASAILIIEIIRYARRVIPTTVEKKRRRRVLLYFLGFMVWIMALPIGILLGGIPGVPEWIYNSWPLPYGAGLLLIAYTVAVNPRLLYISEARPLDILVLDGQGTLVFTHRFHDYPNAIDSELMGSAMSGVTALMKEMLASGERLHRIDHGDVIILVEPGTIVTSLLIVSRETSRFRQLLRNVVMEFEAKFREELLSETPLVTQYEKYRERVQEIFL